MKIYASTDRVEIGEIIDPDEKLSYNDKDLTVQEGSVLEKKLDFNPVSSVEFKDDFPLAHFLSFVEMIKSENYWVGYEIKGVFKKVHFPQR